MPAFKIFLMILFFALVAFGQEASLTLNQSIRLALDNNPNIQIQQNTLKQSELSYLQTYSGILPTLDFSANTGHTEVGTGIIYQYIPTSGRTEAVETDPSYQQNNSLTFSANWTIIDRFYSYFNIQKGYIDQKAAEYDYEAKRNSIILDVKTKFYDALQYQKLVEVRLNWNLFNGFSDYLNYEKAIIAERNQAIVKARTERNIKQSLLAAYDNYQSAIEVIKINELNLESASEEYRLATERRIVGSATQLEVRDAQVNLTRAEQSLVEARFNALKALAQIEELTGKGYQANE
jgi:outer membrane protein TolC